MYGSTVVFKEDLDFKKFTLYAHLPSWFWKQKQFKITVKLWLTIFLVI